MELILDGSYSLLASSPQGILSHYVYLANDDTYPIVAITD